MKISITLLTFSLLFLAGNARAEFTFACGANREKGPEQAEIAFVDSLDGPMKLMLAGTVVDDEKLGTKALDDGRWMVSVDQGAGRGARKFLFVQGAHASVRESHVSDDGDEGPGGARKPCVFDQKKMENE